MEEERIYGNKRRQINMVKLSASIIILMVCSFAILLFDQQRNSQRTMNQIDQYISELSYSTAEHVEDVFADKLNSVETIAYLYGRGLKTGEVDLELLAQVEARSGFQLMRFIDLEGTDYRVLQPGVFSGRHLWRDGGLYEGARYF